LNQYEILRLLSLPRSAPPHDLTNSDYRKFQLSKAINETSKGIKSPFERLNSPTREPG
jgi:hypothetical protein